MRRILFLTLALSALAVIGPSGQPLPCTQIEAQTWWTPASSGKTSHVHMGGCLPIFRTVSGVVPIDIQFKLHNAAGVIDRFDGTGTRGFALNFVGNGEHLIDDLWVRYLVDTRQFLQDGEQLIQFQGKFRDADGVTPPRLVRLRAAWRLANGEGRPVSTATPNTLEAHAWFAPSDADGRGYTNAVMARGSVPMAPVSLLWQPYVKFANSNGQTRDGFVSLDPDIHAGNMGDVLLQQSALPSRFMPLPVDPAPLTEGRHKLFVKASDAGRYANGALESALVVGFDAAR